MNRVIVAFTLALSLTSAWAAPAEAPGSYAAQWPLQLPAGASLARLPLSAEVLTRVQTVDLRDLRVFNAAGQPVPVALDRSSPEGEAPAPITLPALPILTESRAAAESGGVSLRIEDGPGGNRVVRLDSAPADAPSGASAVLAGALIDTGEQKIALQAMELDARWPEARPFTFHLHASGDLRNWRPLGEVTAYRGADGTVTVPARLTLNGDTLPSRYLRITWDATAPPGAVQLNAAHLLPMPARTAPARIAVPLTLPEGAARDPRVLEWRLPFATPLAALDIRAEGSATLVPVRIFARQQREQPWTPLARHVVFSLTRDGQVQRSPALELNQAAWREWRVEADGSSPGFTTPPQVTAWLAPLQLVFVANGAPPFTLAAGRADAPRADLPLGSLIPDYRPGEQNRLPTASLGTVSAVPAAIPAAVTEAPRDLQRWILWAILAVGVLALGGMAWRLTRQLGKSPPSA
jgi:hypothetical protein